MRIQVLSDLHGSNPRLRKDVDAVVCAGDLNTTPDRVRDYFKAARKHIEAPFVYVLGNHEYYGHCFPEVQKDYARAVKDLDVQLLMRGSVEIEGVTFLGDTMWTDFDNECGMASAAYGMNDYEFIRVRLGKTTCKLTPADILEEHKKSRAWLLQELDRTFGHRVVVVTHHMPSHSLISSRYAGDALNGAFAANLDLLMQLYRPKLWVYGHTHIFNDSLVYSTRCVCNPGGYRGESCGYRDRFVVEV